MWSVWHDARYGLRLLRREPGFALVAIVTIALGIGAATTRRAAKTDPLVALRST